MTTNSSDAALVAGHLAGDPSALGGIYDRYADSLHDTAAAMLNDRNEAADVLHDVILIAAERLGQLRDPDRLKPWLFAILRNEVYRRSKKRRRTIVTDFSGSDDGYDLVDDQTIEVGEGVADDAAGEDLAELVRGAARGLDERDQLVLELSVRQGLGGQDLADALGVSANQSYTLVHRMRERVERSLSAYVVAKAGRNDCGELDKLLGAWDGEFNVLIRKRVSRHVDKCETCDSQRRRVAPLAMFAAAPVYAAPAGLRDRILGAAAIHAAAPTTPYQFTAHDGFPKVVRTARRVAAWVAPTAAASLVLIVAALSFFWLNADRGGDGLIRESTTSTTSTPAVTTTTATATTPTGPATTLLAGSPNAPRVAEGATSSTVTATSDTVSVLDPGKGAPDTTVAPPAAPAGPASTPVTTQAPSAPTPSVASPPPPPADPAAPAPPPPPSGGSTTTTTTSTTAPPRPGQLTVSGGSIDLGSSASSGSITLTNTGDLPLDFSVAGDPAPFSVSPTSGTLAGGASTGVSASIDRSGLSEGSSATASVQVFGAGSTFNVNLSASGPENPPVLRSPSVNGFCSSTVEISGTVSIVDASGVASATLSVSGPSGLSGSASMSSGSNGWFGSVSVFYPPNDPASASGTWSWTITASDTRGNTTSTSNSLSLSC